MGGGTVTDLVMALSKRLDAMCIDLDVLDNYYTGQQPLNYLHPDVRNRLQRRLNPVCINWPRLVVSAIEERLDVEGFRSGEDDTADQRLWGWWQANDLDEQSQLGHIDALVHGQSYVSVWAYDLDPTTPRIAVESSRQMVVDYIPGTRKVRAALKSWAEGSGTDREVYGVLYLPDRVERYVRDGKGPWVLQETLVNPLNVVPIVPLVNRPRLASPMGESELTDILPIADAVNKLATDMMVSSEFHAMPRRWVTGMELPSEKSAQAKLSQEVIRAWTEAFPGKPWMGGKDVSFGQFGEASLDNFINAIKMLQSEIAALSGLPPHYLGINTDNPASADAIRSSEASLVKKAERKQRAFGGSWERVMRLGVAVVDGTQPPALDRMETIWRDPATPTPAQKADAAVKLTQGDRPVITLRQAREDLGYTPTQIDRMEAEEQSAQDRVATGDVRAKVDLAHELMTRDGLTQSAAYAAVGLIAASQQMSSTSPPAA